MPLLNNCFWGEPVARTVGYRFRGIAEHPVKPKKLIPSLADHWSLQNKKFKRGIIFFDTLLNFDFLSEWMVCETSDRFCGAYGVLGIEMRTTFISRKKLAKYQNLPPSWPMVFGWPRSWIWSRMGSGVLSNTP